MVLQTIYRSINDVNSNKKYEKIPFVGKISLEIVKTLKSINVVPVYYNAFNLGKTLINNTDEIEKEDLCGVSEIACTANFNAIYNGRTTRKLKVRFNEHVRDAASKKKITSGFFSHLRDI